MSFVLRMLAVLGRFFGRARQAPQVEIEVAALARVFPQARAARLEVLAAGLAMNLAHGRLGTRLRMAHFLGQVRAEVGPAAQLEESLNYSVSALARVFSIYRRNPALAAAHGRKTGQRANQQAIANHAYAGRIGNGNIASGDGWRYRGRGLKQLTGRANYADFTKKHRQIWGGTEDFEANPDLLLQPKYALRSALYYWLTHRLFTLADQGMGVAEVNAITTKINPGATTQMRAARVKHAQNIWTQGLFASLA